MNKNKLKVGEQEFDEEFSKDYSYDNKGTMISANIAYYSGLHFNKEKLEKWNRIKQFYNSYIYVQRQTTLLQKLITKISSGLFKARVWIWKRTGLFIKLDRTGLLIKIK